MGVVNAVRPLQPPRRKAVLWVDCGPDGGDKRRAVACLYERKTSMRLAVRLFLLVLGLIIAVPFGAATLVAGAILDPATRDALSALGLASAGSFLSDVLDGAPPDETMAFIAAVGMSLFALLVAPPALVALIGEVLGLRSFVWHGGAAGALTSSLPWLVRMRPTAGATAALQTEGRITALLFLTGAVSGLGYWLVAGRSAGRPNARPASGPPYSPSLDQRG
jgi:hypothetical protein